MLVEAEELPAPVSLRVGVEEVGVVEPMLLFVLVEEGEEELLLVVGEVERQWISRDRLVEHKAFLPGLVEVEEEPV